MGPMGAARRRGRRRGLVVGAAVGSAAARKGQADQAPAQEAPQAQPVASTDDSINQLQQLAQLKDQGILTEEEFTAKKKQILGL